MIKIKRLIHLLRLKVLNYVKNNVLFLSFLFSSIVNTSLLRFLTVKNYFNVGPILLDITVLILIASIGYLIKPKKRFKYYFSFSIVIVLLCIVNSIYYTNYISFTSVSLLATSLQVIDVSDAVIENVMELKDFTYFWQIAFLMFIHFNLKKQSYYNSKKVSKNSFLNCLIICMLTLGLFICTMNSTDYSRIRKQWNREYIVIKFGILTYQLNDIFQSVTPQISPLFGYDKANREFREFYASKNSDENNMYTNIFKGKNILMIHAESVQNFLINTKINNKEVTPNLNRLAKEGLYFSNFYAQESVGTSSDSEFTLSTSLLPSSSGTVFVSYWDRKYITMQRLMKEQGYYTFSMHGNKGSFWNRNVVHKEFGYDDFYYYNKDFVIDDVIGLGLSDKSFFKQVVPKIKEINNNNEHFFGTLIMLTNHTPFTDIEGISNFAVDYKYSAVNEQTGLLEQKTARYLEKTKMGSYIKSVHYADEAIGQLLADLEKNGLLDNTVIVIYGDHDAKLKMSEYNRYYNYDYLTDNLLAEDDPRYVKFDEYDYEINRKVPFIIWTKDSKDNSLLNREITSVMGMYDVLPTLGNMVGIGSPYALGHDIFSIDDNVVVFHDASFITDKIYYNSQKGEWALIDPDFKASVAYIEKYKKQAERLISVSNDIIVYDLIRKKEQSELILRGEK